MIYIGYQGIGKSTLAKNDPNYYIDLESNNFVVNGKKLDNWHIAYCQTAEYLSQQGYSVFVSSHKEVRDYLKNSHELVTVISPSLELKDEWIKKLKNRWEASGLDKDYRAYINAFNNFEKSIEDIISDGALACKFITNMDYDLISILEVGHTNINRRPWKEFMNTKLLWFANTILHAFGWAIVIEQHNDNVINVYPARVKFRGFDGNSITNGYIGLSKYMLENAEELLKEAKE